MVNQGGDLKVRDHNGCSALHFAAQNGDVDMLKYLIQRGSDLDQEDGQGRSPLYYAVLNDRENAVKYLIENFAWIDQMDGQDDTPLHIACRFGYKDIVQYLISKKAKIHLINSSGLDTFAESLLGDHVQIAKLIYKNFPNQKEALRKRYGGYCILNLACGLGRLEAVKFLLEQDSSLANFTSNKNGLSPLHSAIIAQKPLIVEHVLATKPNLEHRTEDDQDLFDFLSVTKEIFQNQMIDLLANKTEYKRDQIIDKINVAKTKEKHEQQKIQIESVSNLEAFKRLSQSEKRSKVIQWTKQDFERVERELGAGLSLMQLEEVNKKLVELAQMQLELRQLELIYAFRADNNIREKIDNVDHFADIVEKLKNKENNVRFNDDPNVVSVLQKMNQLTLQLKQLGFKRHVSIYELIIKKDVDKEIQKDQKQLNIFNKVIEEHIDVIIEIVTGDQQLGNQKQHLQTWKEVNNDDEVEAAERNNENKNKKIFNWSLLVKQILFQVAFTLFSLLITYYLFGGQQKGFLQQRLYDIQHAYSGHAHQEQRQMHKPDHLFETPPFEINSDYIDYTDHMDEL